MQNALLPALKDHC